VRVVGVIITEDKIRVLLQELLEATKTLLQDGGEAVVVCSLVQQAAHLADRQGAVLQEDASSESSETFLANVHATEARKQIIVGFLALGRVTGSSGSGSRCVIRAISGSNTRSEDSRVRTFHIGQGTSRGRRGTSRRLFVFLGISTAGRGSTMGSSRNLRRARDGLGLLVTGVFSRHIGREVVVIIVFVIVAIIIDSVRARRSGRSLINKTLERLGNDSVTTGLFGETSGNGDGRKSGHLAH